MLDARSNALGTKFSLQEKTQLSRVDFSAISLAPFAAGKEVKTAACTYNGAPLEFIMGTEFFKAPFGASAYKNPEATRLNLELDVTQSSVLPTLELLEETVQKNVEVSAVFHSNISFSEKHSSKRLRTKLNMAGHKRCRFFDTDRNMIEPPDLRNCSVRPHISLRGLWKQGNTSGLQLECLNLMVAPAEEEACPF